MTGYATLPYRLVVGAVRLAAPLLSGGDSKLARGLAGRRRAHEALAAWGKELRDPGRPLVWFHAPSVGEALQARAVIDALRALHPELQVAFTYFSPSAEGWADRIGADVATYLPWDLKGTTTRVLDAIRPDALVFTKTEVWPVLSAVAGERGIPVAIVGATVPEGAGRLRWPVRWLLGPTWRGLALACASSAADAEGLVALGVRPDRVEVTGDPGIDSAAARFEAVDRTAPWLRPFLGDPRPTVVAGSTWPSDEAVLVPALTSVRAAMPSLRVILAPHEPSPAHVAPLRSALEAAGWPTRALSEVESSESARGADAVVVDRVGVLAQLYALASASYVGGGFHDAGLHSVLEPAAAGSPVAFGPRHVGSRAAVDLLGVGGAKIARNADELARLLVDWLDDQPLRDRTGAASADYIGAHRGAAARCAALLTIHLTDTR